MTASLSGLAGCRFGVFDKGYGWAPGKNSWGSFRKITTVLMFSRITASLLEKNLLTIQLP
jgi:hypothetical protein